MVLIYMRASGEAVSRDDRAVHLEQPQKLQTSESRQQPPGELARSAGVSVGTIGTWNRVAAP